MTEQNHTNLFDKLDYFTVFGNKESLDRLTGPFIVFKKLFPAQKWPRRRRRRRHSRMFRMEPESGLYYDPKSQARNLFYAACCLRETRLCAQKSHSN